mgnify:CR=1 FL=1
MTLRLGFDTVFGRVREDPLRGFPADPEEIGIIEYVRPDIAVLRDAEHPLVDAGGGLFPGQGVPVRRGRLGSGVKAYGAQYTDP